MALTLDQLLKLTNLSPDVKQNALLTLNKMSEDQKFELSQICWTNIAQQYENKAALEYNRMLEDMASGERNYGPDDFQKLDEKIIVDLLLRIDSEVSGEKIADLRKNLVQYVNKAKIPQA